MAEDDNLINWDEDPITTELVNVSEETIIIRNPDDEVALLVQHDSDGNEIISEVNFSSPELDEAGAREVTDRIKTTTNVLYMLIKRAHAGKAYRALGYSSFEAYVKAEFDYSKVYAYRLINQANFIEAIEAKVPEGTEIRVSEPVSSRLKKVLPELIEEIEERIVGIEDPDEAGVLIEDIIQQRSDERKSRDFLDHEDDDELSEPAYEGTGGGQGAGAMPQGGQNEWDDDLGDYVDDEEVVVEAENSNDVRRKFDKIYNIYSGMRNIANVGDHDELIPFLPHERYEEFTELLKEVIPKLQDFQTKFNVFIEEQGAAPQALDSDDDDELLDVEDADELDELE